MIERAEPVTTQINQIIRERIQSGTYHPGDRLPSESELAVEFGVSRSTLRLAVNSLVSEGVIIRRHGDGTYVNQHAFQFNAQLQNLWSFPQLISESGHTPDVRGLGSFTRQPSIKEIQSLELDQNHQVYVLERLFYADQIPVIFSTNIIPISYFIDPQFRMDTDLTIYEFMKEYCDLELVFSTSEIHSAKSDNHIGNLMQIQPNDPLICFHDLFFTRDGKPVVFGVNYYNDQKLTMRLVRSRV